MRRTGQPGHPLKIIILLLNLNGEISSQSLSNRDHDRSSVCLDGRLGVNTINLAVLATTTATTKVQSKEGNLSNLDVGGIAVATLNLEGLSIIRELQAGGTLLDKANSIIEVELALSLAISANGDDELEIVLAERSGGHGTLNALGDDGATAVVERDVGGAEVLDEDGLALTLDLSMGVEVVEDVLGEVGGDVGGVLIDDGADEDAGTEEVLGLDAEGGGILGVVVEEWAD